MGQQSVGRFSNLILGLLSDTARLILFIFISIGSLISELYDLSIGTIPVDSQISAEKQFNGHLIYFLQKTFKSIRMNEAGFDVI